MDRKLLNLFTSVSEYRVVIRSGGTKEDYQEIEGFLQEAEFEEFSVILKQIVDLKLNDGK
ncbi:hypothetical protein ACFYU8_22905 [Brevibacillus sp. NPDC003359]|uniref:hypothetical protein n=1 Tax=unclassified Brevibacillus TaxID=2684853 RepID=UPI0036820F46